MIRARTATWLAVSGIALALAFAYANSFRGVFVFDDLQSIVDNPTIRHLGTAWAPPGGGTTVSGRPLLNLSLALNYAVTGPGAAGFHAGNLLIHFAAALTLFGLVRQTVRSTSVALGAALLWAVHPLQTESVTYLVQRAESQMGLFYLLTLYSFIRFARAGSSDAGRTRWDWISICFCYAGMATKEVMVTAPLVVFLYAGLFVFPDWKTAWRAHRGYWIALASSWILLAIQVAGTGGNRNGSIGFGISVPWWKYALTECHVILRYLRLSIWPYPQVFYYNAEWASGAGDVIPGLLVVIALVSLTLFGLARRNAWAFLGAWFFLILAPTSSIVPGATQTIAEHRMYLPLAALTVGAAVAFRRVRFNPLWLVVPLFALLTFLRNGAYASDLILWNETAARAPDNELALHNLGNALLAAHRPAEAMERYRQALKLRPDDAKAHHNLGYALLQNGRTADAIAEFRSALRINPDLPEARLNLGNAYLMADQPATALPELTRAVQLTPADPKAHYNLALALFGVGQAEEGLKQLREALRLDPNYAPAREALKGLPNP